MKLAAWWAATRGAQQKRLDAHQVEMQLGQSRMGMEQVYLSLLSLCSVNALDSVGLCVSLLHT